MAGVDSSLGCGGAAGRLVGISRAQVAVHRIADIVGGWISGVLWDGRRERPG